MLKSDLRKNGLSEREIIPKQSRIALLWMLLTVCMIAGTWSLVLFVLEVMQGGAIDPPHDTFIQMIEGIGKTFALLWGGNFEEELFILGYFVFFILILILYLLLKLFMTIVFCHTPSSIRMKILKHKGMPVCSCTEAFKVWENILIYVAPVILIYSLYLFLSIRYQASLGFMLMFCFMIFFMAFDLTLIIYVISINIKDRADYISLERHVYSMTLFHKTYVRANKKAGKRRKKGSWKRKH